MNARGWMLVGALAMVVALGVTAVNQAQTQTGSAQAGATRVAVVDIVRVFDNFEQTKVLNKQQQAHLKNISDEADKRANAVQAEQQQLTQMAEDSAEWYGQNEKVKKMMFEAEVWSQIEKDRLEDINRRWTERTYRMMTQEIERVAKARGIQVVLTREQLKSDLPNSKALLAQILNIKVVYAEASPQVDMTEEVLANLNAAFQKAGGPASVRFHPGADAAKK